MIFERSPSTVIWTFGVDVVPGSFGSCVPWVGPAVGSGAFGATGVTDRPLPDAGFEDIRIETRRFPIRDADPLRMAIGQIRGTPRAAMIERRGVPLEQVIEQVAEALTKAGGNPYQGHAQGILVEARAI